MESTTYLRGDLLMKDIATIRTSRLVKTRHCHNIISMLRRNKQINYTLSVGCGGFIEMVKCTI